MVSRLPNGRRPGWRRRPMREKYGGHRLLRRAVERRWLDPAQLVALSGPGEADESEREARFSCWLDALLDVGGEALDAGIGDTSATVERLPRAREAGRQGPVADGDGDPLPLPGWERYELLSLIGRGGMGRVYRARDPRLNRFVAIKLLRYDDPDMAARFLREAQAQAQVEHPAICRVYEVGEAQGQPFIAMQLIDGGSLRESAGELTLEQKLLLGREVALALHEAHRNGLVHRDIKPANILLERGEEGEWRPFVVDFGLAREVEQPGSTMPGALMGTAAYMSPEQACGEVLRLDRRTDVYSLGATLYEMLCGVPPFGGRTDVEVLMKVVSEEPEPLRRRCSNLPRDVETIVSTCMAKEPARRYGSARDLAADLRRFLDGEPITARPASLAYRLERKVRKHRAVTALVALAVMVASAAAGLAAHTAWVARAQAKLSQEFASDVSYVEALLRHSYTSPPHDIRAERATARARLERVERRMASEGGVARAPGNLALGRGWLVLQEPEWARSRLQEAWDSGYRGPHVALALGQSLGLLYQGAVEEAERAEDAGQQQRLRAEAAQHLRAPALELLKAGEQAAADAPSLAEALVALYEERFDDALRLAGTTVASYPWVYQAHKLEGDVRVAEGRRAAGRGDYQAAEAAYRLAGEAYGLALSVGRSDADVLLGDCQRLVEVAEVERRQGGAPGPNLAEAVRQCSLAVMINPDSAAGLAKLALAHASVGDWQRDHGEDPRPALGQAVSVAEDALAHQPSDGAAAAILGWALTMLGDHEAKMGGDPRATLDRSIASFHRALAVRPTDAEICTNLGYAHDKRARWEASRGLDPRPAIAAAVAAYHRAIAIDPSYANAYNTLGITHWRQAEYERRSGLDASVALAAAVQAYHQALEHNPNYAYAWANLGTTLRSQAVLLMESGQDPSARLDEARAAFRSACAINPDVYWAWSEQAETELLAARSSMSRGHSPEVALAAGRTALDRALELNPRSAETHHSAARWHLLAGEWAAQRGRSPEAAVRAGLAEVAAALAINTQRPDTLAVRGALRLLRAGAARSAARPEALAARADLRAGLAANPLLDRDYGRYLRAAEELVGGP